MSKPTIEKRPTAVPLYCATLLARFDGIRQFARGGRRGPHKPLLLLYALARLKHDRKAEIRFNTTKAAVQPLLRVYGPWGASAVSELLLSKRTSTYMPGGANVSL